MFGMPVTFVSNFRFQVKGVFPLGREISLQIVTYCSYVKRS